MANIINNLGQVLVGFRSPVLATPPPVTASTLLTSLYSVWNADTTTSTLDSSIYGVYNGDNVNDTSGNARNGTNVGGVTFTTGKVGNAFTFNGSNYVSLPTNSLSSLTGDFSVSAWVNLASLTTRQCILANYISVGTPAADIRGFRVYYGATGTSNIGGIRVDIGDGTSNVVNLLSNNYLTTNTWYHIVVTRKGSTGTNIYINGSLVVSNSNTINPTYTTAYPTIGTAQYVLNSFDWYMSNGSKLDAVTIWNKKLTDDEITQLYNIGSGTEYPFSGQTLPSANNQFAIDNGTLMNGCTFADGIIGKAFTFDGVDDYVSLPNNSLNFTGDFSVSFWINPTFTSGIDYRIIGTNYYAGGTYGNGWQFARFSNNNWSILIGGGSTSGANFTCNNNIIPNNTWSLVTITRKKSTSTKIYVNGTDLTSQFTYVDGNSSINPTYTTTQYCQIGANKYDANPATGFVSNGTKIDGISVWQKELTASEVTELYNSGTGKQLTVETPIVTNGLVLNLDASRTSSYPNTGTTWYDISGNGNNGTMTNGPIFGTASGGAITFDGVNDYIGLGTKTALAPATSDFTISFWLNPNNWGSLSSTSYSPIFVTLVNGGLWIGKNGPNFVLRTAYIADDIQYSVLPTVNQWTMVTINRVGNTAKIYYNGSVVASATVTRNYVSGNSSLGVDIPDGTGNYSNIKLSTFNYYNRGLSDSEITQNFNATKSRFGL